MCGKEVNLVFRFPCKLMASKNFDWIKHDQSEANIVFAIPVNSSFSAVNFPSFLTFYNCPCKTVKCGFFVLFAIRRKICSKQHFRNIFHHLCFKCNYMCCANVTFALYFLFGRYKVITAGVCFTCKYGANIGFALQVNLIKTKCSEMLATIVNACLSAADLSSYHIF